MHSTPFHDLPGSRTPTDDPAHTATRWMDAEGRCLALRPLQPDDAPLLGSLWNEALSRPARFNRFHAGLGRFSPERLRTLCQVDPAQGGAWLVTQRVPGGEEALAEGRWAWQRSPGDHPAHGSRWAELSVSVADRWQGRGLGLRLVQAQIEAARRQGALGVRAVTLPGNGAMQALLVRAGFTRCAAVVDGDDGGTVTTYARVLTAPHRPGRARNRQRTHPSAQLSPQPVVSWGARVVDQWVSALLGLSLDRQFDHATALAKVRVRA